ncbi:MAG TPA: DNA-processing protein DprA [Candidatus Rubneribacter avistercoris]|nr:DNA-processing protein DprA [Candidatus Rubneribacter avistercoris]
MSAEVQGARARIEGPRTVIERGSADYPASLERVAHPPDRLYVVGDPAALAEGVAIVGARKATPYGVGCARRFARIAAERGVSVVSGGARGCDAAAHCAALEAGGITAAFLGGGCDRPYPAEHAGLFQRIVDAGGAVVSEHAWGEPPLPYRFRARNRLIAGLARATLIVEAGLPSGTFSTADEALAAGREVLVVPGAITAPSSRGANRLLRQGATPIVDDDSFEDALFSLFGCLKSPSAPDERDEAWADDPVVAALRAEPLGMERLYEIAAASCGGADARSWLMERLVEAERAGLVARQPDGRWGPALGGRR